jgi:hypothetical protein
MGKRSLQRDRPTDFNIVEMKNSFIWIQVLHCKYPLRNSHLCSFGVISKTCVQLSKKTHKILLPFPMSCLCEVKFSLYTSTKVIYQTRLNAEADRIQLSFIKQNVSDLQKCKTMSLFLLFCFVLDNIVLCYKNMLLTLVWNGLINVIFKRIKKT